MDTWALSFWFSYLEGLTTVYICSDPSKRSVHMLVEFMVMHDVLLLYCVLDKQHVQVLPRSLLNKWDRFFSFQPFGLLKNNDKIWTKLFYHFNSREKMFQSRVLYKGHVTSPGCIMKVRVHVV